MKTLLTHWTLSAHPAMHRVTQATNDERTAHETRATNARSRCTGTEDTQHGAFEIVSWGTVSISALLPRLVLEASEYESKAAE